MIQWYVVKLNKNTSFKMKTWLKKQIQFFRGLFLLKQFKGQALKAINQSDIVFFFPFYHTGGAERVHLNIVQALINKKCAVIFTQGSATTNFLNDFKQVATVVELNPILNKRSKYINGKLKNLLANTINSSASITHVFGCNSVYFYKILPLFNSLKIKLDLIHALAENDERARVLAETAKYINTRVVINKKAKIGLKHIYLNHDIDEHYINNITIISNGVNISKNDDLKVVNKVYNPIKIGYIGRWSDEKRPNIFLEIAQLVKEKHPKVQFVMAGTGMKSNIESINTAGVSFLGELTTNEDLKNLYKSLNIIVICSEYEGFPMVLMEAMPFEVVPVCTNVGGISEHIINNQNGILIDNIDNKELAKEFTKVINVCIEQNTILKKMAKQASSYAFSHFDISKFNLAYKQLFNT